MLDNDISLAKDQTMGNQDFWGKLRFYIHYLWVVTDVTHVKLGLGFRTNLFIPYESYHVSHMSNSKY